MDFRISSKLIVEGSIHILLFLLQVGLAGRQPLEVCNGNPSSAENPLSPLPLMEGPEPYGMRRMPLSVRRPFVLEQETI